MARLYRPHVPLLVRCTVAERQLMAMTSSLPTNEFGVIWRDDPKSKLKPRLDSALFHLAVAFRCKVRDLRLDHDPPLALRLQFRRGLGKKTYYEPDANDSEYLRYRPHGAEFEGSHAIKTFVRGDHGQFSDVALIKRERRRQRKKSEKKTRRLALTKPKKAPRKKFQWPKRKFPRRK